MHFFKPTARILQMDLPNIRITPLAPRTASSNDELQRITKQHFDTPEPHKFEAYAIILTNSSPLRLQHGYNTRNNGTDSHPHHDDNI